MSEPIVLGIESTCDETAAAVVQGRTLISNVVASSMDEHARYGGVIPELASRAHQQNIVTPKRSCHASPKLWPTRT